MSIKERIEKRSVKDPATGCWIWAGSKSRGYGETSINGKHIYAHRASYQEYVGEIPVGMLVLHKCDTPSCVNPDHLFLGSSKENAEDRDKKGRQARGQSSGMSKLTDNDVIAIRKMDGTHASIGRLFGVNESQILRIRKRETWRHL